MYLVSEKLLTKNSPSAATVNAIIGSDKDKGNNALQDILGLDLRDRDLRYAKLSLIHLLRADLRKADLTGATLYEADLTDANLRKADLDDAYLKKASLNDANLRTQTSRVRTCIWQRSRTLSWGRAAPGADLLAGTAPGGRLLGDQWVSRQGDTTPLPSRVSVRALPDLSRRLLAGRW